MAERSIWKGSLHFGDIDIPVKLQTAVKEDRISFNLLHKNDRVKLKQQMICAYEKKAVPSEEQVRGFQVDEEKYILIDPEDLEKIQPEDNRVIEVHEFVKSSQIDPLFIGHGYYLKPEGQLKEYNALAEALAEMKLQGICTWTMRKRAYFGALELHSQVLMLNTMRYADEVINAQFLEIPDIALTEKELQVGADLINHLTTSFESQKYVNEHQVKLQKLIDKKARGEKIIILRPKRLKPTSSDKLLKTLEESLKKVA